MFLFRLPSLLSFTILYISSAEDTLTQLRNAVGLDPADRLPSALLHYTSPTPQSITHWFQEIAIEESAKGSYFSLTTFSPYGYAGIQSLPSLPGYFMGQIIFSIWDKGCHGLDNAGDCPMNERAEIVRTGKGVKTKRFGSEGTGYQARLEVSGYHKGSQNKNKTFGIMIVAEQAGETSVYYTGYFYTPGNQDFKLLAKIRVGTGGNPWFINGMGSFVEHFLPIASGETREAYLGSSWVRTEGQSSVWIPVTEGRFSLSHWNENTNDNAGAEVAGKRWHIWIGENMPKTDENTELVVEPGLAETSDALQAWNKLEYTASLPTGCAGMKCSDGSFSIKIPGVGEFSGFYLTYAMFAIAAIVLLLCAFGLVSCFCSKASAKRQRRKQQSGRTMAAGRGDHKRSKRHDSSSESSSDSE